MKFFIDTEFMEDGPTSPIFPISIGVVAEDGREFYAEVEEAPLGRANDFVRANVLPQLSGPKLRLAAIASALRDFVGPGEHEFWGYFADYDWVIVSQLFGRMVDLPQGWPKFCLDLKQVMHELVIKKSDLPPQNSGAHHALADARWNRDVYYMLEQRAAGFNDRETLSMGVCPCGKPVNEHRVTRQHVRDAVDISTASHLLAKAIEIIAATTESILGSGEWFKEAAALLERIGPLPGRRGVEFDRVAPNADTVVGYDRVTPRALRLELDAVALMPAGSCPHCNGTRKLGDGTECPYHIQIKR